MLALKVEHLLLRLISYVILETRNVHHIENSCEKKPSLLAALSSGYYIATITQDCSCAPSTSLSSQVRKKWSTRRRVFSMAKYSDTVTSALKHLPTPFLASDDMMQSEHSQTMPDGRAVETP